MAVSLDEVPPERTISVHKFSTGANVSGVVAAPADVIWDVIAKTFGDRKHAVKHLARAARTTPGTAKNWLSRRCTPQAENLIALMAELPELKEAVDKMVKERQCSLR